MPPATATSRSPARTAWSTIPAARMPEAQTLLTVSEGTSFGIPPLICAWRLGIWPWPAWSTWPNTTCCDLVRRHLGALERGGDGGAAEIGGVEGGERRRPSSRTASARRRGSRSWACCERSPSGWRRRAGNDAATRLPPLMAPITVSARSGAPEDTAADTRVVGALRGRVARRRPRFSALVELGEAKRGLQEGRGRARGRARRRPAARADRRPGQARRASTPSRRASRRPPRRRARKELGAVSLSWASPGGDGVDGARSWRARS